MQTLRSRLSGPVAEFLFERDHRFQNFWNRNRIFQIFWNGMNETLRSRISGPVAEFLDSRNLRFQNYLEFEQSFPDFLEPLIQIMVSMQTLWYECKHCGPEFLDHVAEFLYVRNHLFQNFWKRNRVFQIFCNGMNANTLVQNLWTCR
jgi:hypothetical protein